MTAHSENNQTTPALAYTHPLKAQCRQFLSRHQPKTAQQWLHTLSASKYSEYAIDAYGQGKLIQALEERMAELLGKERALFCHKGMVGQLSTLKYWSEVNHCSRIAIQPRSHIDHDEQSAYETLWGLKGLLIGSDVRPIKAEDLSMPERVAAVSIELPHRRAGFLLPSWSTLSTISETIAPLQTALHFDGARLLEASVYWQKTPAQVGALCDSVYVSMYKMLGALAGGIVASDRAVIEGIKPWITRSGGDVHTLFPFAISAMWGLDNYLPRIAEFRDKAKQISTLIASVLGEAALPPEVQTNSFLVRLPQTPAEVTWRALQTAEEDRIWLFDAVQGTPEGGSLVEIQVGDALDHWSDEQILTAFRQFA